MTADGAERARAIAEVMQDLADCRIDDAIRRSRVSPHRGSVENALMSALITHVSSDVLQALADQHRAEADRVGDD